MLLQLGKGGLLQIVKGAAVPILSLRQLLSCQPGRCLVGAHYCPDHFPMCLHSSADLGLCRFDKAFETFVHLGIQTA